MRRIPGPRKGSKQRNPRKGHWPLLTPDERGRMYYCREMAKCARTPATRERWATEAETLAALQDVREFEATRRDEHEWRQKLMRGDDPPRAKPRIVVN